MYLQLFNEVSESIESLQSAQLTAEAMYVETEERVDLPTEAKASE